jgi:hypothetical protein
MRAGGVLLRNISGEKKDMKAEKREGERGGKKTEMKDGRKEGKNERAKAKEQ